MVTGVSKDCARLGLYLAALGSRTLRRALVEADEKKCAEWAKYWSDCGVTPDVVHDVQARLRSEEQLSPYALDRDCAECKDPCPDPPCDRANPGYVCEMIELIVAHGRLYGAA